MNTRVSPSEQGRRTCSQVRFSSGTVFPCLRRPALRLRSGAVAARLVDLVDLVDLVTCLTN